MECGDNGQINCDGMCAAPHSRNVTQILSTCDLTWVLLFPFTTGRDLIQRMHMQMGWSATWAS